MRSLRLVALSDDGTSLILAADGDRRTTVERFELPIDDRLRAAARGDARRLHPDRRRRCGTELPPRVIQARIRAGETPRAGRAASGTRVERIMRFAHPVLQERARVAEQARDARVRLSEGTPSVPLQRFMAERLRLLGRRPGRRPLGRPPRRRRRLAGHRRLARRRQVRHHPLELRPPRPHGHPVRRRHDGLRRGHPPGPRRPRRPGRAARPRPAPSHRAAPAR